MLTDVAYNWRKAKLTGRNHPPPLQALQAGTTLSAHNSVFLPWGSWGDDVMVIRDWMAENGKAGQATARIYGRFEWSQRRFNLACKLVGLAFEFTDMTDLLYFKLRWYHPTGPVDYSRAMAGQWQPSNASATVPCLVTSL